MNGEKYERALHGTVMAHGEMKGGVGDDASEEKILAEYDRLGGLVKKGKYTVKMGSFYDFKAKKPRIKPEVTFLFRNLDGETVEIPEGDEIPMDVKAAEMISEKKRGNITKGGKKIKKVQKAAIDADEDGNDTDGEDA